eukprot:10576888-Alexandrium_andersonii.AAC.1
MRSEEQPLDGTQRSEEPKSALLFALVGIALLVNVVVVVLAPDGLLGGLLDVLVAVREPGGPPLPHSRRT